MSKTITEIISIDTNYLLKNVTAIDAVPDNGYSGGHSSSDIWFLTMDNIGKQLCLKLHISPNSITNIDPNLYFNKTTNENALSDVLSLEYEIQVYYRVQELIDNSICSSFIRSYGYLYFSYSELLQLAANGGISDYQLNRNIYMMRINQEDEYVKLIESTDRNYKYRITYNHENNNMPKYRIRSIKQTIDPYLINFMNYTYIGLFTETFDLSTTTNIFEFCHSELNKGNGMLTKLMMSNIFQVLVGCYALQLIKTTHNDLMLGNILVRPLTTPEEITYIINEKVYTICVSYQTYIYDYDRSYCKSLGPNINLDVIYSEEFSQYNACIPNKDMCQFIQNIRNQTIDKTEKDVLNGWLGITDDEYWNTVMNHPGSFLQHPVTNKSVSIDKFAKLNSVDEIILNVVNYMGDEVTDNIVTENLHIIHPDMCNENGIIDESIVKRERDKY